MHTIGYVLSNLVRGRQISDPRDKVFDMLGLARKMSAAYSLSRSQVYERPIRRLIAELNNLNPLLRTEACKISRFADMGS
ncbi:uncharacterized protein BCR38DRAFT_122880 [Pseudomassariella vexata]|uniref:Uncharacterized protein n=1 Tax=Pseudomassariella vexata TaxID=1141098 RepID=A0A1Y2D8Q3_9PEZI|nr:uncharacterized protein BCR38DRAFT_122880 [Pseudomassariella vexata]ORY55639.1 hypothetical protein BCR38DRAFT_122880 [Pseudomassariella vexata]